MTTPIFILSSGRSGSQMMEKLFSSFQNTEVHHEYLCNIIQPLGTKYYMNLVDGTYVNDVIDSTYGAAIDISTKDFWIDSSNKLSWIAYPISMKFPNAKFIHIVRDGRRVVSSYFNKLSRECYDDFSSEYLYKFLKNEVLKPPPEKKFWWPLIKYKGSYKNFINLNQFQKICVHWSEVNKNIEEGLKNVSSKNIYTVRLEDLVQKKEIYNDLISFLEFNDYNDGFNFLQKPHNVNYPKSFELSEDELKQFNILCGDKMKKYGYDVQSDYKVDY